MEYIRNEKLLLKAMNACKSHKLILITGATGFGKTAFIEELLKGKKYDYFSLRDDIREFSVKTDFAVIDDFQFIIDHMELLPEIQRISYNVSYVIISSRSDSSSYFMDTIVKKGLCEIREADLAFPDSVTHSLLDPYMGEEYAEKAQRISQGNPLGILLYYEKLSSGASFDMNLLDVNMSAYYDHLKAMVMDYIDPKVLNLLLEVSVTDSFTLDFASFVSLNPEAHILLQKALSYGSFIKEEKGVYTLRLEMLHALRKRYHYYCSDAEYNEFRIDAGRYYEAKGDFLHALDMYEASGSLASVKRCLLKNSVLNPSHGKFKELRRYYMMLSEEDISSQPVLMSGMSMLYSLLLDTVKSEEYYQMLKSRMEDSRGAEAKEIRGYLDYLDFALPHRSSVDIFGEMRLLREKSEDGRLFVQHYSLTDGVPSVIHGARDFSLMVRDFEKILEREKDTISFAMGRVHGKGIIPLIRSECLFESGADEFAVLSSLVPAKMEADKQELDNLFVLVRIEASLALERGEHDTAKKIIQRFMEECKDHSPHLLKNAEALYAKILIYADCEEEVRKWMEESYDENETFFITDRMLCLSKVYGYIYLKEYSAAYILLQKLAYYAKLYGRRYLSIEIYLLSAIIEYLTERDYKDNLLQGLELASSYGLVRVVSGKGILVYEMMEKLSGKIKFQDQNQQYQDALTKYLVLMSNRYPLLFNKKENLIPELSRYGLTVLELQAQGYSLSEIARRMGLNPETVRYHAKQNYKKLGASGKAEAVAIAKRYGMI